MKLLPTLSLAFLSAFSTTLAADCGTTWMGVPDTTTSTRIWNARSIVCNCIADQPGNYCAVSSQYYAFAIWGVRPAEQLCWDAFENIIDQCILGGLNSGLYQYDGSNFQLTRYK